MKKRFIVILISSVFLLITIASPFSHVGAETTQEVPRGEEVEPQQSSEIIEVKFVEGSTFRLREGALTAQQPEDLVSINSVINSFAVSKIERLFSQPEQEIEAERAELLTRTGENVPDLNLWFRVWVPEGQDPEELIAALNALPEVQTAYAAPLPAPPPSINFFTLLPDPDQPPAIPNYESNQGYLNTAPGGIDAKYAWGLTGGKGNNVQIVDIEYTWNTSHVDLPSISLIHGAHYTNYGDDHGTAVLGELVAKKDGVGVSGIAYQSTAKFSSPCPNSSCTGFNQPNAINAAKNNTVSGDVILIEQQTGVCGTSNYGPIEWYQSNFDAIKVATTAGRIVVEAAGNGSVDLDGSGCNNLFNRSFRDSGAIIVGAGAPPGYTQTARSRLDFSSYGSRVDVQGWGRLVVTTGYGDLYTGTGKNQWYTNTFSGTSSASPIVAGAAALLSSVAQARGISLTPLQIRSKLVSTGSPQQAATGFPTSQHIGPLPNVKAAINTLTSTYVPKPLRPVNAVNVNKPTYKWTKVNGATNYVLQIYEGNKRIFTKNLSSSVCGSTTCQFRTNKYLPIGYYKWRVKAKVGIWRKWSNFKNFNVATPFHYFFNNISAYKYWHGVYGPWKIKNGFYQSSGGLTSKWASAYHEGNYSKFQYIVNMKRVPKSSTSGAANIVLVRGKTAPVNADKMWSRGYSFHYANNGYFGVWKWVNGNYTCLKGWTYSSAIHKNGWNAVKIKGVGTSLKFYINNKLVWSGTDSTHSTGKVGVGFFKNSTAYSPLLVDAAHLVMNVTLAQEDDVWAEIGETVPDWDNPFESPPEP